MCFHPSYSVLFRPVFVGAVLSELNPIQICDLRFVELIIVIASSFSQDIAAYIKKEFDKKYNPTWHAIVGRNFGSYVTHETKHFIYFYLGQVAILLFKSG
jgi:dynein light chain LC8-type